MQPRHTRLSKAGATSGGDPVITETDFFKARTQFSGVSGSHPMVYAPGQGSVWELKPSLCPSRGLICSEKKKRANLCQLNQACMVGGFCPEGAGLLHSLHKCTARAISSPVRVPLFHAGAVGRSLSTWNKLQETHATTDMVSASEVSRTTRGH